MARPVDPSLISTLGNLSFSPTSTTFFLFLIIIVAVFSIISLVSFLCASHHMRRIRKAKPQKLIIIKEEAGQDADGKTNKLAPSPQGNIGNMSGKALLMVKMISWRKKLVQAPEAEEEVAYYTHDIDDDDEAALWRKTIIMGERCRPLDFSGKILYDSHGNLLPN